MAYILYDAEGKELKNQDLQNKSQWCQYGASIEESFVNQYGEQLDIQINPDKKSDPFVPDLRVKDRYLADLKTQNTPFFMAAEKYGINPSYAVVFNIKDHERYASKYPEIIILFWVVWKAVRMQDPNTKKEYRVNNINGVWAVNFKKLSQLCKSASIHSYAQRQDDNLGNAKASYVLSIKDFKKII